VEGDTCRRDADADNSHQSLDEWLFARGKPARSEPQGERLATGAEPGSGEEDGVAPNPQSLISSAFSFGLPGW
jgi:hypothetical protein